MFIRSLNKIESCYNKGNEFHLALGTTVKELATLAGGGVEQGADLAGTDGQVHGTLVCQGLDILIFFTLHITYLLLVVYH